MTTLGIVGGLGPESTIDYYRRILEEWKRDDLGALEREKDQHQGHHENANRHTGEGVRPSAGVQYHVGGTARFAES